MESPLLLVGASVRAAAQSAAAAGFAVTAADLFADVDLARCAAVHTCRRYPTEFIAMARAAPAGPWMYTGGLENYPRVVDAIARERPLWGHGGEVLRRVRHPQLVVAALRRRNLAAPQVVVGRLPPPSGDWLWKPRRGSGGQRIERWRPTVGGGPPPRGGFFQQFVPGQPCGGVFLATGKHVRLLGVTEQLLGSALVGDASADGQFRYAGSLGPLCLSPAALAGWLHVGEALAREFSLRGLFGVDAVWDGDSVWPVEVNPRYTASIEVLEAAYGWNAVAMHAAVWRDQVDLADRLAPPTPGIHNSFHGKAIVYAPRGCTIGPTFADFVERTNHAAAWPTICDIPRVGTDIPQSAPVVTVRADGKTLAKVRTNLASLARQVERMLLADDTA